MPARWEAFLRRWVAAGLVEPEAADRIRAWETNRVRQRGPGWPVLLALGFGALLIGAGVLLFVAANWDELSPGGRFALVLTMIATFHAGGALASERSPALATALHAVGTVSLGGGIALGAQIFHLEEHWPGGILLWALGACCGVLLLRDWPQAALAAVLVPAWLASERVAAIEQSWERDPVAAQALLLLAFVYVTARAPGRHGSVRRALSIIGTAAMVPLLVYVFAALDRPSYTPYYAEPIGWGATTGRNMFGTAPAAPAAPSVGAFVVALALPVAVAFVLRRRDGFVAVLAALWIAALNAFDPDKKYELLVLMFWCTVGAALVVACGIRDRRRLVERIGLVALGAAVVALLSWAHEHRNLLVYAGCAAISVALAAWGVRARRKDAINLAVLSFGVTVAFFYFSAVMDKLGRSASLIGLGLLFLGGGFALERTRRRLVSSASAGTP